MVSWPSDYGNRWTLANEVCLSGVGLHTGATTQVVLAPREHGGFAMGLSPGATVNVDPSQVIESRLCTRLQLPAGVVGTVEHLLAALAGVGMTDVLIHVDGPEIPVLDGSALPWVEAIEAAGMQRLGPRHGGVQVASVLHAQERDSYVLAVPYAGMRLSAAVSYASAAIGQQFHELELSPAAFVEQIAPARTFGFAEQVEALRASGLIRGGSLKNALVCDQNGWLNPPLRFADEPVRHKLLDLIGDLALVGLPQGHVSAYRASHALHTRLAAKLVRNTSSPALEQC